MPRKLSSEHYLELESLYRVLQVFGDFADALTPDLGHCDSVACALVVRGRSREYRH